MKNTDKQRDPIPEEFGSEEEAAAFWETHSLASYQDLLEPVEVDVDIERRHFEIEVEEQVFLRLTEKAEKAHTSVKDLASRMLREKLATA